MELPEVRLHRLGWASVALILWCLVLWLAWAANPLIDEVSVLATQSQTTSVSSDEATPAPEPTIRIVTAVCGAPWEGRSGPAEPLPALNEGERYSHDPCRRVHRDNRIVLGMNVIVVAAGFGAVILLATRRPTLEHRSSDAERDADRQMSG